MSKKVQINLSSEAFECVRAIIVKANDGFEYGRVNQSKVINKMILDSNINIKNLRSENIDIKRSLRNLLKEPDADVETAFRKIEALMGNGQRSSFKKRKLND